MMQDLKSRYLGRHVPVTIREVSRADRKITFNMVEAAQILAYRSVKVWPRSSFGYTGADARHHSPLQAVCVSAC